MSTRCLRLAAPKIQVQENRRSGCIKGQDHTEVRKDPPKIQVQENPVSQRNSKAQKYPKDRGGRGAEISKRSRYEKTQDRKFEVRQNPRSRQMCDNDNQLHDILLH